MAWIKTTSTYRADWRNFSLTGRSLGQLAKYGLIGGLLWGFLVAKVLYGLPGDKARSHRPDVTACQNHPGSIACIK